MIQIKEVSKTFKSVDGEIKALDNVSLSIEKGEIFGVIGLSGAGKSTLIRCINKLETPDFGKIIIRNEDILQKSQRELNLIRKDIGMIFQHFNLLSSRDVYSNIAFPLELAKVSKDEIETRVDEILDLVALSDKKHSYISTLSGGQKQRVAIARALITKPQVLLCDEATSALDPKTTKSILDLIKDLCKKLEVTVVLITHQMEVVDKICDRVAIMEGGRVIEVNTLNGLINNPKEKESIEFLKHIKISA
ncbi:MAG: ATP-binding cassette domain-containing protein [Acidaminobacteraceae bacterium]